MCHKSLTFCYCQKSYWCGGSKVHEIEVEADAPPVGEFFEEPPTNVKPGIRIKNLKKVSDYMFTVLYAIFHQYLWIKIKCY